MNRIAIIFKSDYVAEKKPKPEVFIFVFKHFSFVYSNVVLLLTKQKIQRLMMKECCLSINQTIDC